MGRVPLAPSKSKSVAWLAPLQFPDVSKTRTCRTDNCFECAGESCVQFCGASTVWPIFFIHTHGRKGLDACSTAWLRHLRADLAWFLSRSREQDSRVLKEVEADLSKWLEK
eukprot:2731006-Rhodomonas_salina.1